MARNKKPKPPVEIKITQEYVDNLNEQERYLSFLANELRTVVEAAYGSYLGKEKVEDAEEYVLSREIFNILNIAPAVQVPLPVEGDMTKMSLEDVGRFYLDTMKARVINTEARISRLGEIQSRTSHEAYTFVVDSDSDSEEDRAFAWKVVWAWHSGPIG